MNVRERLPLIFWSIAMLVLGGVLALFFVFRTLFTDGPANVWHPEYLVAHALNLLAFFVTATFVMRRGVPPAWALLVPTVLPAALVLAVYGDASAALRLVTLVMVAVGTAAGALLGHWWRRQKATAASAA